MKYNVKFFVVLTEYQVDATSKEDAEQKGIALFDQDQNKPTKTSQLYAVVTPVKE